MTSSASDRPVRDGLFDVNWLCLYAVFFTLPIIELTGLASGVPSSVPVGTAVASAAFAICLTLAGGAKFAFPANWRLHALIIPWQAIGGVAILFEAQSRRGMAGFGQAFWTSILPMVGIAAVIFCLTKIKPEYNGLASFAAGAAGLMLGALGVHGMLALTIRSLPNVYDPVLFRFEHILGLADDIVLVRLYGAGIFGEAVYQIYSYLNIGIILAAASEFIHAQDKLQASLFLRFLVVAMVGYGLYYLMPALAPAAFFGTLFPDHLPDYRLLPCHVVRAPASGPAFDPRNTMPSLHATWAILAFLALRRSPAWHGVLGFLFVLSIVIVTLGSGQHYTVDWIAALPLVLFTRGIAALALPLENAARRNSICVGLLLLFFWVVAVRWTPESLQYPWLIRSLALGSVGLPVWLEHALAQAEQRVSAPQIIEIAPNATA